MQLLSEFRCRGLTLRNRVVMAPMTREHAPRGVPTQAMQSYYQRRAAGGTALIISEGAAPELSGSFGARVPHFFGEEALQGWQRIGAAVHQSGAAIFAQLWHVGAFDPSLIGMQDSLDPKPVRLSPSGLAAPGRPLGSAMTSANIDAAIATFAQSAAAARDIGFDGVEIHGAHGYLPDQFLWAGTNQRSDRYGGDLNARTRFAADLVSECRRRVGADFILSFRLSQWKQLDYGARIAQSPEELKIIVEALSNAGVDIFHCSARRYWEAAFDGSTLSLAGWVRRLSGKPTIAVGSVTLGNDFKSADGKRNSKPAPEQIEDIERRLCEGEFDLIAVGRALLANPDWVRLVEAGRAHELKGFSKSHLETLS
jgi:2,4-dienoyl-CoA reductase-like NADH-dependent reductase (Old Yellow Enzyme family)